MTLANLRINIDRLTAHIEDLAEIGAIAGGGVCRMALTDEDRQGRDMVVKWMHELGLEVTVDQIGNDTTVDWFCGVTGPPVNDITTKALL